MVDRDGHRGRSHLCGATLVVVLLLSVPPLAQSECVLCGGPDNLGCAEGEFCKRLRGYCHRDAFGLCTPVPLACATVSDPVCGCDGNTYSNPCSADFSSVSVAHAGRCESACTVGADTCAPWSFCRILDGCVWSVGGCAPSLAMCDEAFSPVCGCDGLTYRNRCLASQARVSVDHWGICADACPADPDKLEPGVCGCGYADDDVDRDGTPDCIDVCPTDPASHVAGVFGPEFQVHVTLPCLPLRRRVAIAADGRAAVVFSEVSGGVTGRRIAVDGGPDGEEMLITGSGTYADVAMAPDGRFAVVWSEPQEGAGPQIVAMLYDAEGTPVDGPFTVNLTTATTQNQPQIGMDGAGSFVVVWRSEDPDTGVGNLAARRFSATGVPLGGEIRVTEGAVNWSYPALAVAPDGSFAVAGYPYEPVLEDRGAYVRLYGETGAPRGTPFRALTDNLAWNPTIAMDGAGNLVVAARAQEGDQLAIRARRFAYDGTPLAPEFQVTADPGLQSGSPLAVDSAGRFVVLWGRADPGHSGQDDVYGQRYDENGLALGSEFRVNTFATGRQAGPAVAANASGAFVAAWASLWSRDDRWGIFGTRGHLTGDEDGDGAWDCNGPCETAPPGACCAPADGTLTTVDDGNACTTDTCWPDGTVTRDNLGPPDVGDGLLLDRGPLGVQVDWSMPEGALASNLYRGTIEPGMPWAYNEACLASGLASPHSVDPESPAEGQVYTYLATAVGTACEGPIGVAADGQHRYVAASCTAPSQTQASRGSTRQANVVPGTLTPYASSW